MPEPTPEFWLSRLTQRLMARQARYATNEAYAIGDHPVPNGDPRYVKALKELQAKATTNYVGLAIKAATDMRVKGFKFGPSEGIDPDARRIWDANNMSMQSTKAIHDAAKLSDVYAIISPPDEEGGEPIITIEDPRTCIVEQDPLNAYRSRAGLKLYEDTIEGVVVACLMLPDAIYLYRGPARNDFLKNDHVFMPNNIISGSGGFVLTSVQPNPLGEVPMIRGNWRPEYGILGMAECEDGGFPIQDRINYTVLSRMVITNSQAYRQRWMSGGVPPPKGKKGGPQQAPFDPGADTVWALADPAAKFGDFDQADITQLLEAVRDDVGDFAALTQTPVTYLTNKMVNVSGETLTAAQVSLISKKRMRMESMGWFFEQIMKVCFKYKNDSRATEMEAETLWADPEVRSMAEIGDYVSKMTTAGVPLSLVLERAAFTPDEVEFAVQEAERVKQEGIAQQEAAMKQQAEMANKTNTKPQAGSAKDVGSAGSGSPGG